MNIKLNQDNPNKLTVLDSIEVMPMLPKHVWEEVEKKANNDLATIRKEVNEDPIGTGPYKMYFTMTRKSRLFGTITTGARSSWQAAGSKVHHPCHL